MIVDVHYYYDTGAQEFRAPTGLADIELTPMVPDGKHWHFHRDGCSSVTAESTNDLREVANEAAEWALDCIDSETDDTPVPA